MPRPFGGTQCSGVFWSRSPKPEEKVFIDLSWLTQNVCMHVRGHTAAGEMGGAGCKDRVGAGEQIGCTR